ncbi:MAG TPA: sigma-54 dependent transcriptional regulator [Candidatus Kapabacteria bacterium]|nr:sigma-54 dependent transcriptional regulator [Candidatus Kapabacteria bacterium]
MANRILIVDDEPIIRESIVFILSKEGYSVAEAANGKEAADTMADESFDLVITDLEMPEMKGLDLLDHVMHVSPQTMVVIITAFGSLETAIEALRKGASDYILKPIEFDELLVKVKRLLEHRKLVIENQVLRRELHHDYDFANIIGKSTTMLKVFDIVQKVSGTISNVLITGKSGTGKELVGRAIHFNSPRKDMPFITVNCGAIPESLIESELFGSKKGSFTGSTGDKIGFFKAADGGTLFLDEIGEMPLHLQVKLLRAIEQKEITPVGASSPTKIDVRFIAATNKNLLNEVQAGKFREDLFYRLNVVEIKLPSLSERREDVPLLVEHFIQKYRDELKKNVKGVDNDVMNVLIHHEWKGEIRELENIIERAVIFCDKEFISVNDLPGVFQNTGLTMTIPEEHASLEHVMNDLEKKYIEVVLKNHEYNKDKAAQSLKISLPTLYRRIKDLGIAESKT